MQRLDTSDYLYWSDTEIRVSAASFVKAEGKSGIGTGKFIVKNKWGDTTITNSELFVEYAIQNQGLPYPDKYIKKRANLIKDTIGYVFSFSFVILNDPIKKAVTEKAIRDWACQTGVNFKVFHDDTTLVPTSVILFGNSLTNSTDRIAYTDPLITTTCFQNDDTRHEMFVTGFEIEMNFNVQWDYDTLGNITSNKYSYYSVLIHELGHVHQLEHILNDNSELMRPIIATGQYRTFSPNLFAGTDDVINYNLTYAYVNCSYSPMVFGNPNCSTNSINESTNENDFIIYPNPFNNEITIDIVNPSSDKTEITIYNVLGEIVFSSTQISTKTIKINLENLNEGIYVITLNTANKISNKKIIKTR